MLTGGDFGGEVPVKEHAVGLELPGRHDPERFTLARVGEAMAVRAKLEQFLADAFESGMIPEPARRWFTARNATHPVLSLLLQFLSAFPQAPVFFYHHRFSWQKVVHHVLNYRTSVVDRSVPVQKPPERVLAPWSKSGSSWAVDLPLRFDDLGLRTCSLTMSPNGVEWATPGGAPLHRVGLSKCVQRQ